MGIIANYKSVTLTELQQLQNGDIDTFEFLNTFGHFHILHQPLQNPDSTGYFSASGQQNFQGSSLFPSLFSKHCAFLCSLGH